MQGRSWLEGEAGAVTFEVTFLDGSPHVKSWHRASYLQSLAQGCGGRHRSPELTGQSTRMAELQVQRDILAQTKQNKNKHGEQVRKTRGAFPCQGL